MLDNGADINAKDDEGLTPLHLATIFDYIDVFKLLFYKSQEFYKNKPEEFKKIINTKDNEGVSILHIAAWHGNTEIIKLLLDNGSDINAKDNKMRTPLHVAMFNNQIRAAKFLIDNGADINAKDNNEKISSLFIALNIKAITNNCLNISKKILEKNFNFNEKDNCGNNILHICAKKGNTKLFKQFIGFVNINEKNFYFETALHMAVNNNNIEIVKLLLDNGADVNAKDVEENTPLHIASEKGYTKVVNQLLTNKKSKNKININEKDNDWNTPLHMAANNNKIGIVKLLLDNGADVNAKDVLGIIPLCDAVNNNNIAIIKLLFKKENDININNNKNKNTLYDSILNWPNFNKQEENKINLFLKKYIELNNKINLYSNFLKNAQDEKQKTENNNNLKKFQDRLKELLIIKLSDVITKNELRKISDNSPQTILNCVRELNSNLDIDQVKVQENSITDTTAIIKSTDHNVYNGDSMKVTFIIDKREDSKGSTQNYFTNFNNDDDSVCEINRNNYVTKQDSSGDNSGGGTPRVSVGERPRMSGAQQQNPKQRQQTNLYDVSADGSCLFWSVATSYLLPIRNNNEEFRNRFIQLFGELQLSYLSYVQTLFQQFDLENHSSTQILYQDATINRLVRVVFRNRVVDYIESNLDIILNPLSRLTFSIIIQENNDIDINYLERMRQQSTWGGTPEIIAMSNILNSNISVNNDGSYQPINPNSSNTINLSYVNRNHYNFALTPEENRTNQSIAINDNQGNIPVVDTTKRPDNLPPTTPLQKDEYHFVDKKTEEKSLKNDENLEINLIKNNNKIKIKQNVPVVNKPINKNIINAQITATKAINQYNALSKEEKLKKLNEINRYYQTLSENDKKTFKEKLTNTGLAALSGGALTAYGTKMTVSSTAATGVTNAEAMEMTPLLSTSTTESLAAAETITVAETAAVEGGIIAGETGTAAALAPETLGLSVVIGGLAIAGTWMYFAFHHHSTSDIALPASIHHNVYDNIEKWYKFLAHDKLKIKINKNTWNEIKQNKNSQATITKIIKNKFIINDHSGWGGSVTNEDFNTLVKVMLLHFEQINGYFEILDNENDGFVIITNTEGDWLGIE